MIEEQPTQYFLRCCQCGTKMADDGLVLFHKGCDPSGLLQTIYAEEWPGPGDKSQGLFQYRYWLPVRRTLQGSSASITYRSRGLADQLNLENLFITFSGYWPERGVFMRTCTFKELEAYSVCARLPDDFSDVLVVASAGNTARSFLHVCSQHNIRALIIVPEWSIPLLWRDGQEQNDCVRIIALGGNSDYADAILLADNICKMDGFIAEGGARNVARRDALGTAILSCVAETGRIPDEYFQAVGSGTGAIAAWEASVRLSRKKVCPGGLMRLHVAQNLPLAPIYKSWERRTRRLISLNSRFGRSSEELYAGVLFNRRPSYGVVGGLYDALLATKGHVYGITNEEAISASKLFEKVEGVDIDPAAAIAVACLIKCVSSKKIQKGTYIMLNITGGGLKNLRRDVSIQTTKPIAVVDRSEFKNIRDSLIRKWLKPLNV